MTKNWKMPARESHAAKAQFALLFADRFEMNHSLTRPASHRIPDTAPAGSMARSHRNLDTLNGLDPESYLRYVLERIAEHPIHCIDELLPWHVQHELAARGALAA